MKTATARKRHLEINTCLIVSICNCPILFAFYNFGKVRYHELDWCVRREIKYRELKLYRCMPKLSSKR